MILWISYIGFFLIYNTVIYGMESETIPVPKETILKLKAGNEKILQRLSKLEKKLKGED